MEMKTRVDLIKGDSDAEKASNLAHARRQVGYELINLRTDLVGKLGTHNLILDVQNDFWDKVKRLDQKYDPL